MGCEVSMKVVLDGHVSSPEWGSVEVSSLRYGMDEAPNNL
jgi:hypothetical protein